MSAPFPIEAGDTVSYITKHGFQAGYFVRWNQKGAAVIRKPAGGNATVEPRVLRPCNDGRMVRKRGWVDYRPPHLDAPRAKKEVRRA